jgi:hypothetical protein
MADDEATKALKLIGKRHHQTYDARSWQMYVNILGGMKGGREYVDERLCRYGAETTLSFEGGNREDGSTIHGRRDQTHAVPRLRRLVDKINQYVISPEIVREGCPDEICEDIDRQGSSVDDVMRKVNDYLTTCGWAWIGIDAPAIPEGRQGDVSIREKEEEKLRPYWTAYSPLAVVDWKVGDDGRLEWLITETEQYVADDPFEEPKTQTIRKLWERGRIRTYAVDTKDDSKTSKIDDKQISYNGVPFILVGEISPDGQIFDDLESVNRSIMNLGSVSQQNLKDGCYPQMYLPARAVEIASEKFSVSAEETLKMIRGFKYPILLEDGDPTPGYVEMTSSSYEPLRKEQDALKKDMHETYGLMLAQETKAAVAAESKAWDFIDINAVMRERASKLQKAETQAAAISHTWDPTFPEWKPIYPTAFDVHNFNTEIDAIIKGEPLTMPDSLRRFQVRAYFHALDSMFSSLLDDDQRQKIVDDIEAFSDSAAPASAFSIPEPDEDEEEEEEEAAT